MVTFVDGQILTASQLNTTFSSKLDLTITSQQQMAGGIVLPNAARFSALLSNGATIQDVLWLDSSANLQLSSGSNIIANVLLRPSTDNSIDLGTVSQRFRSLYTSGAMAQGITVVTASGNYNVAATDATIIVNKITGAATSVVLPPAANVTGRVISVVDGKGDAATNAITLTPNGTEKIDGGSSAVINVAHAAMTLQSDGTGWWLVGNNSTTSSYNPAAVNITGGTISGVAITASSLSTAALTVSGAETKAVNLFTGTGSITMGTTDRYILVKKATPATTTVTLVSSPATGRMVTIKDAAGNAATYNITIQAASGTIDGAANVALTANYASIDLIYNGSSWSVV